MRKIIFAILGLLTTGMAYAAPTMSVNFSDTYVTRYIWRGYDLYPNNDGAHQPSLTLNVGELPAGLSASFNFWASFATQGGHKDGEEFDYTASLSKNLTDKIALTGGIAYYDYYNTNATADIWEPFVSANFILPLELTLSTFIGYDFQAKSGGVDDTAYWAWGLSRNFALPSLPIFQKGQALTAGFKNWGQYAKSNNSGYFVYATDFSLSTTYNVGKVAITPAVTYTPNYRETINNGDDEFWGGITVGVTF
jgi:hypothetical protein